MKNTLNPSFATPIKITYSFEEVQKLEFRVYDVDTVTQIDTLLGSAETTLGSVSSTLEEGDNTVAPIYMIVVACWKSDDQAATEVTTSFSRLYNGKH